MSFDEQPDDDIHGECAEYIHRLEQEVKTERARAAISEAKRQQECHDKQSLQDQADACLPYLKEGETVADALKRLSERKTVRSLCEAYEACKPFLKDGEAPAECLARNRNDIARLMGKWGAEKMTSARLRTALDKIAQTTGSDDPCRPLVQIARDALKPRSHALDCLHINQGSTDAAADAYEAEYASAHHERSAENMEVVRPTK